MLKLIAKDGELLETPPSQSRLHPLTKALLGVGALGVVLIGDNSASIAATNTPSTLPRQISLHGEVSPGQRSLVNCDLIDYRHSPSSRASRSTLPFFIAPEGEELIQSAEALRSVMRRFVDTKAACTDFSVEPLLASNNHLRTKTNFPSYTQNRRDLTFSFEGFTGQGEAQMAQGADITLISYEEKRSEYQIEGLEDLSYYMAGDGHWISHEDAHKQSFSDQQLAILASTQLLHPPTQWEKDDRGLRARVNFEDKRWATEVVNGQKRPEIQLRQYNALYFVNRDGSLSISARYLRNKTR